MCLLEPVTNKTGKGSGSLPCLLAVHPYIASQDFPVSKPALPDGVLCSSCPAVLLTRSNHLATLLIFLRRNLRPRGGRGNHSLWPEEGSSGKQTNVTCSCFLTSHIWLQTSGFFHSAVLLSTSVHVCWGSRELSRKVCFVLEHSPSPPHIALAELIRSSLWHIIWKESNSENKSIKS